MHLWHRLYHSNSIWFVPSNLIRRVRQSSFLSSTYHRKSYKVTRSSYLKGSQHAAGHQYKKPEVHVEELGDFISHENWENQQKQTHAEATEVSPHTPGSTEETVMKGIKQKRTLEHEAFNFFTQRASLLSLLRRWNSLLWLLLPVARCAQSQNNWICYLDHRLQGWSHHDEEDDAEEEGALQCLHV